MNWKNRDSILSIVLCTWFQRIRIRTYRTLGKKQFACTGCNRIFPFVSTVCKHFKTCSYAAAKRAQQAKLDLERMQFALAESSFQFQCNWNRNLWLVIIQDYEIQVNFQQLPECWLTWIIFFWGEMSWQKHPTEPPEAIYVQIWLSYFLF